MHFPPEDFCLEVEAFYNTVHDGLRMFVLTFMVAAVASDYFLLIFAGVCFHRTCFMQDEFFGVAQSSDPLQNG